LKKPQLKITLASPHKTFFNKKEVSMITFPSISGEFQLARGSVPRGMSTDTAFENIAELKKGFVTVKAIGEHDGHEKEETFLIQGGFAFHHDDENHCSLTVTDAEPVHNGSVDLPGVLGLRLPAANIHVSSMI